MYRLAYKGATICQTSIVCASSKRSQRQCWALPHTRCLAGDHLRVVAQLNYSESLRALLIAMANEGFTEAVSERYLSRISDMQKGNRLKYLKIIMQPSEINFDERLTALVIFDHSLQSNDEWNKTIEIYSLNEQSVYNEIKEHSRNISNMIESKSEQIRNYEEGLPWYRRIMRW